MEQIKLKRILDNHKSWLESNGKKGMRADLRGANLKGAKLIGADLRYAILTGANLQGANLQGANISNAYLVYADLTGANLKAADLEGANIQHAYLTGANLRAADLENVSLIGASLTGADLTGANLRGADIEDAYLEDANLEGANLSDAVIRGAYLRGANVENAILPPSLGNIPEGELIGYKRVKGCIIKLQILADSKRSRATGDKCRCDKALVLAIENEDGTDSGLTKIVNRRYATTTYQVGKIVYADSWDKDRWAECSHGIHFFLDRKKAVDW